MHKLIRVPDGTLRILVQGIRRIKLDKRVSDDPYLVGDFSEIPDELEETKELEALTRNVQNLFGRIIAAVPYLPEELQLAAANVDDPSALSHLVASTMRLKTDEKQALLETANVEERLRAISGDPQPRARSDRARLEDPVAGPVRDGEGPARVLPPPAAEGDPGGARRGRRGAGRGQRAARRGSRSSSFPRRRARRPSASSSRLEKLPSAAAEYGVIRTYLDWILTLPWSTSPRTTLDLDQARKILDEDHFDLEKVKERIVEYLAVSKLKGDVSGPILCFVGPPGVGKTSLGQSIARTLGRKFVRISVGGVRDEAEIRGHRRTYIGAMPGTIIRALRDAESKNPVFLIDEIDKMGADWRGDPSSAMLEVLDPEQNATFRDHYLDLPFDLSKVLFICTANQLETIPGPLLDRMDVIQLSGYTEDEKLEIAKRYLLPKQLEANGLEREAGRARRRRRCASSSASTRARPGVRNLERRIADLCRKAATQVAEGKAEADARSTSRARPRVARPAPLRRRGRASAPPTRASRPASPSRRSAATCCSSRRRPTRARASCTITGQLGEVMQESAQAALSWVRSHAGELGLDAGLVRRRTTSTSTCRPARCRRTGPRPA